MSMPSQTLKLSNPETAVQQNSGWTGRSTRSRYPSAIAGYSRHCSVTGDPWRAESQQNAISRRSIVLRFLSGASCSESVRPVYSNPHRSIGWAHIAGSQCAGLRVTAKKHRSHLNLLRIGLKSTPPPLVVLRVPLNVGYADYADAADSRGWVMRLPASRI